MTMPTAAGKNAIRKQTRANKLREALGANAKVRVKMIVEIMNQIKRVDRELAIPNTHSKRKNVHVHSEKIDADTTLESLGTEDLQMWIQEQTWIQEMLERPATNVSATMPLEEQYAHPMRSVGLSEMTSRNPRGAAASTAEMATAGSVEAIGTFVGKAYNESEKPAWTGSANATDTVSYSATMTAEAGSATASSGFSEHSITRGTVGAGLAHARSMYPKHKQQATRTGSAGAAAACNVFSEQR